MAFKYVFHTTIVCSACRCLTKPKHVADYKVLIKLCLDLFFYTFINSACFMFTSYDLFVTLREEHRLGVFESGMLRKVFGYQSGELTGDWRRLHGEKLHYFMLSLCILLHCL